MKRVILLMLLLCLLLALPLAAYAEGDLLDMDDGVYAIEVTLTGGSGKATVVSPCRLDVLDGHGYATLEWSSSNYDYMLVGGEKYLPINDGGNSVFVIPILVYDEEMPVIADTTAMGTPHEVNYVLTFRRSGIMGANETPQARARYSVYIAVAMVAFCLLVSRLQKNYKKKKMKELLEKKRAK